MYSMQFRKREKVRETEKDRRQSQRPTQAKKKKKIKQMWESNRGQEKRKGGQKRRGLVKTKKMEVAVCFSVKSLIFHLLAQFAPNARLARGLVSDNEVAA